MATGFWLRAQLGVQFGVVRQTLTTAHLLFGPEIMFAMSVSFDSSSVILPSFRASATAAVSSRDLGQVVGNERSPVLKDFGFVVCVSDIMLNPSAKGSNSEILPYLTLNLFWGPDKCGRLVMGTWSLRLVSP